MKVIKGLILFCFLSVGISACFDPPEFNIIPEISFKKIQFKEVPGVNTMDTLILYLDFKDGDGDLGIDPDDLNEPFNASYYYLADGTGDTTRVATSIVYDGNDVPYILVNTVKQDGIIPGKLVTKETRNEPNYGYLPEYDPLSCVYYTDDVLLVPEYNVDSTYNIVDTLYYTVFQETHKVFLIKNEYVLYKSNPNHNNIDVKFWVYESSIGDFQEFNWLKEYCFKFDARFPVMTNKKGPLEGTLRYAMQNNGFISSFSIKTLKLSVKIRDRALHVSDSIFTPNFTLDEIRAK